MKWIRLTIFFVIFGFAISSLNEVHAQSLPSGSGLQPFIRYFKPSDYHAHAQNWDVAQGPEGLMYVANTTGLLQYDGYHWNKISMPNHNIVKQVELYDDTVFVGAKGTWGYVKNDSTGSLKFISMNGKTEAAGADVKTIWNIVSTKKALYIQSGDRLMRWNKGKLYLFPDSLKIVSIFRSSVHNLFAFCRNGAIVIIDGKTIQPIYNRKGLKNKFVKGAYDLNGGSLALFTTTGPLILNNNKISPWVTEAQNLFKNNYIINTLQLANGNIALATTSGLIIISPSGKLLHHINKTNGLPFNIVTNLFRDKGGNLWLAMYSGLAVLNASFSVNHFSREKFGGRVRDIAFYKNHFFIATTQNTYKLTSSNNKEQFEKILQSNTPCQELLATQKGLLIGCGPELKIIRGNSVNIISNNNHVVDLTQSEYNQNVIYASSAKGLFLIHLVKGKWETGSFIYKGDINSASEVGKNDLIAETATEGVLRLKIRKDSVIVKRYGKKEGLPSGRLILGEMGNLFLVTSGDSSAWFRIKKKGIKIIGDPLPTLNLTDIIPQDSTTAWSWNGKVFIKLMKTKSGWQWKPIDSGMFHPYTIDGIFPAKDNGIWISGGYKLIHISKRGINRKIKPPGVPVYRNIVSLNGKPITFNKNKQTTVENKIKGFRVSFSSLPFQAPDELTYQSRLIGFSDEWSPWKKEPFIDYGHISPGSYKLQVRAKNMAGLTSTISSLSLYIEPFWYQTWWAFAVFLIIFCGIIVCVIYWRVRSYRMRSNLLEKRVANRTQELSLSRDKILKQSEQLKKLDNFKNQFYRKISHEFRTPLTLILGPIQNILATDNQGLPAHVQEKLEPVLNSGHRLRRLVDQILELARIESEGINITASLNDLTALIRKTASSFETPAENKEISLTVNLPDTRCFIYYDPEYLEMVLINLLSNAIKFTPPGGAVIIDLQETDDGISINVKDTGIGINDADLPHIFDRFYHADSSMTINQEGIGLGLALSFELIKLHHGHLNAKSEPDVGSSFTIRLQKGKAHFRDDQIIEGTKQQPVGRESFSSESVGLNTPENEEQEAPMNAEDQKTLLVIDDNADLCRYVRNIMEGSYQVIEAYNGKDGFSLAKENLPDIILCDVMMPVMDGFTFSRKLKEHPMTAAIPVIFLTGRADKEGKLTGLETGADDYITKPFDAELLQARVKNMIEQRMRLRRQLQREHPVSGNEHVQSPFEKRVREVIQENMTDYQFGVEKLAREVAVSKSHLTHKLKKEVGMSASAFIRSVRLEQAAEMLKNREGNISEIAYSVGFNSLSYFSRSFKKHFDAAPSEFLD